MGEIRKGIIFDGKARVAIIDIKDLVNEEIKIHDLSPLAAAALGRSMCCGVYLSNNLKNSTSTFSMTINGDGPLGSICVAGNGGNEIRGSISNPHVELPLKENGHLDVGKAVGRTGSITVIKDMGLKEPYVGRTNLVTGEIAEDFAQYLYTSEGIRSAVSLGVKVDKTGCIAAGGIIIEALPDLGENETFMLEDIMTNFVNVSDLFMTKTTHDIFDFYFSHLNAEEYSPEKVTIKCACSKEKVENTLKSLGKNELYNILREKNEIEVFCHFCEKKYRYGKEEVDKFWGK